MKISVEPSNNIFSELGRNTYYYKDLLSELIDNSLAARIIGKILHVRVEIFVDADMKVKRFVIWDDAKGIPAEEIGRAITPQAFKPQARLMSTAWE